MSQNTFECYIDLSNKRPILRDKLTDKDILIVTHTKTDELKIRLFIDQIVHDSNEFEELFDKYGDIFIIVTGYQNNNSEHSNRIIVTIKNANGLNIHSSNDIDYESKATVSYIKQKNIENGGFSHYCCLYDSIFHDGVRCFCRTRLWLETNGLYISWWNVSHEFYRHYI